MAFDSHVEIRAHGFPFANAFSHARVQLCNVERQAGRDCGRNPAIALRYREIRQPGALARSLPGCSKKMLTQTLREMERDKLIDRKVYAVVPPMVEYSLTPMGRLFIEPIEMLYAWAAKNDDALSKLRRRRKRRTASRPD